MKRVEKEFLMNAFNININIPKNRILGFTKLQKFGAWEEKSMWLLKGCSKATYKQVNKTQRDTSFSKSKARILIQEYHTIETLH